MRAVVPATLLRLSLTGAYLVILYFFAVPLLQGPTPAHGLGNVIGIVFSLGNLASFWVATPKALRVTLGGLNLLLALAALLAVVGTLVLGRPVILGEGNVVPLMLYFLTFVPLLAATHQTRMP